MDKIRIVSLGGLDEFYKTCLVVEINDDIFVVDCGLKFPDVTKPGIDFVIPNTNYLVENKHRVRAYFLTHGHDSVIGGLPFVINNVPAPVYCTDITKAFLDMFMIHNHVNDVKIDFHIVEPDDDVRINDRLISLFSTCTNIAKSFGVAFNTDQGNVVVLANNVFDNNMDQGFALSLSKIAKITASNQTLVMLQDSNYADRPGYTNPNYRLMPLVNKIFRDAPGRILLAISTPDMYNIVSSINEAIRLGRKIILYDDSTKDVIDTLIKTNCLKIPANSILPMTEVNRQRAQEILILITGFEAKIFHKISLLASHLNDDQILKINANDTFIIAAHAENDAEIAQTNALNDLYRNDCKIHLLSNKLCLKMHSSEEDIKTMVSIFRPRYYIPIQGTLVKLFANAKLVLGMNVGLNHNSVFVLDNGMVVEFENYFAKILPNKIMVGNIYVDGKGIGDIESEILADRQRFSDDGVLILATTVSKSKREIVLGPDIQSRGLIFVKESDSLMKEIDRIVHLNINQELAKEHYSLSYLEMTIKDQVFKAIRRQILKSPTIIPIIVEID